MLINDLIQQNIAAEFGYWIPRFSKNIPAECELLMFFSQNYNWTITR
jgi:hypothetical protein